MLGIYNKLQIKLFIILFLSGIFEYFIIVIFELFMTVIFDYFMVVIFEYFKALKGNRCTRLC